MKNAENKNASAVIKKCKLSPSEIVDAIGHTMWEDTPKFERIDNASTPEDAIKIFVEESDIEDIEELIENCENAYENIKFFEEEEAKNSNK